MEGKNPSARLKIWQDIAQSEMHIWLMEELSKYDVGYGEVEEFCLGLTIKFKSSKYQKKEDANVEVVRAAMKSKLGDEKNYRRELIKERNSQRRKMEREFGRNTKTYRREIKELRDAAKKIKEEMGGKYEKKIEHLKRKHRQDVEDKDDEIPAELGEYYNLSIFNREKFESIETVEYETKCLGEIDLHKN